MKKAVIYARHITYRQYEKPINEQMKIGEDYAKEHNLEIVGRYSDLSIEKQQYYLDFENLKKKCRKKEFDYILICTPLALGRDYNKIRKFENSIYKYGIKVIRAYSKEPDLNNLIDALEDAMKFYKSKEVRK